MSVLPGSGSYKTQTVASANAELNKNLRRLNDTACCLLNAETSSDIEFVPVYEYTKIILEGFTDAAISPGSRFTYTVSGTDLILNANYFTPAPSACPSGSGTIRDDVQFFAYSDSTGTYLVDTTTEYITIPFANFPSTVIKARIHLGFNSGFRVSFNYEITVSSLGVPSITAFGLIQNNTNSLNISNYFLPKQDLLEVWQSGVFVHYIDVITHAPYVPTCFLSYDPILPFDATNFELEPKFYNTPEVVYMSGADTLTIPANSANSVSIIVTAGTTTEFTVNAITSVVQSGFAMTFPATSLISRDIDIETFAGDIAIITILKP